MTCGSGNDVLWREGDVRSGRRRERAADPMRSAVKKTGWLLPLGFLLGACAGDPQPPRSPEPGQRTAAPLVSSSPSPEALSASQGIVYVVPDSEVQRRTDIWRARLADGAVRPLIETPERDENQPRWSERAATLVVKASPAEPGAAGARRGLLLWKAGVEQELPGERARGELWPTWAPLVPRLAFVVRGIQSGNGHDLVRSGVAVVDLTTGRQTLLAGTTERGERYSRPAFSPDGRVAVEHRTRRPTVATIALLDGRGQRKILTDGKSHASQPSFTRDGRYILFSTRKGRGEPRDVMRMRPDGSEMQPLANVAGADDYLAKGSPARDEVAFLSDRDGKLDVFLVGLHGGPPRNLTASLDMRIRKLRWSPDGNHLALTAFPHDPDLPEQEQLRAVFRTAQVLVIDREGRVLLETTGFAPDWMPPWS